jgi:hypothetical protein
LSTKDIAKARTKPTKPYPDFPLFPHANGQWAKKIRSKFVFFGPWRDPEGALQRYLDQKHELHAGRVPRAQVQDGLTLRELVNHFLTAKQRKVDAGELKLMSFNSLYRTSRTLIELLGPDRRIDDISPNDFGRLRAQFAEGHGPVYTGDQVQRTRAVFKYGHEAGLLTTPMRFGPEFVKPSRKNVRLAKRDAPKRLFTPQEIHAVLKHASVPMKAMILLGINCGMGNTDVAELRMVEREPALSARARVFKGSAHRSIVLNGDQASTIRVVSSDAGGKHGFNPHCVIGDELHACRNDHGDRTGCAPRRIHQCL